MTMNLASWRTSLAGFLAVVAVAIPTVKAAIDGDPATVPDWQIVVAAFGTFVVSLLARDNKTTSEQAGAKPPAPGV